MLTEVQALVLSALLTWLMIVVAGVLRSKLWTRPGLKFAFGNREESRDITPVAARADRAAINMLESFPLFLAVMLGVRISGHHGPVVAQGASLFFWSRVAYWPLYLAGIKYARTAAWTASIVGMAMLGVQALQ